MDAETLVMIVSRDEMMGVERIREALFQAGYRVLVVDIDGIQETLAYNHPDMVIANLSACTPDDRDLCCQIHRLVSAPIIAIASGWDEAFCVGLLETSVDDFLIRPVSVAELVSRVRSILRRRREHPSRCGDIPQPGEEQIQKGELPEQNLINRMFHRIIHHRNQRPME